MIRAAAVALALAAIPVVEAADMPPGVSRVTEIEGIAEYRLANGLTVLLMPDDSKDTITVNMTYKVGSRHEGYGETGMAHLLEHLLFKSTKNIKSITEEISRRGARANGSTWFDRTNYHETFAATDDNLAWALEMEAERMLNATLAKAELDSEMTVVRNEMEIGENRPGRVLSQRMLSAAYIWHNYGKSTIGARSDVENVDIEALRVFYRRWYQPDNAVLVVAGRIEPAHVLREVARVYGPLPRPARPLPVSYTVEPVQDGERSVVLRRAGDVALAGVLYHIPPGSHPDFIPLSLAVDILDHPSAGRLHKALVESGKATSVSASAFALHEPGVVSFSAEVAKGAKPEEVQEILAREVEGLAARPPGKEEVERARAGALKYLELALSDTGRAAIMISEYIAQGDWRLMFLHRDGLRDARVEDVARTAALYFKASNRTAGLFLPTAAPDRAELPAAADLATRLAGYKGDGAGVQGEALDPDPAVLESRIVRATLPGGMKLVMLPKRTRGGTVTARITLRMGDRESLTGKRLVGSFAAALLSRGTKKLSRAQLADRFDQLRAEVSAGGSAMEVGVGLRTVRGNLAPVLEEVAAMLREPSYPAAEFEQLRNARLTALEKSRSDPRSAASISYSRHQQPWAADDPRYSPSVDEEEAALKALKLEDIAAFQREFYGAQWGAVAVVGDFDPEEAKATLARLFGDWPGKQPYQRLVGVYRAAPPLNLSLATPDRASAHLAAGFNLDLNADDPDYPALALANYMLGGGFLHSRLVTRIREKEGLSYSVGSGLSASVEDRDGHFSVSADFAPENAARVEAAMREELARALEQGFSAEEVATAKNGMLQSRRIARGQDGTLAGKLSAYLYLDRSLAWDAEFERRVEALDAAQVLAALRRHLDLSRLSVVKAGDFRPGRGAAAAKPGG